MQQFLIDGHNISIREFDHQDVDRLCYYLEHLSPASKNRFGPHAFDRKSILELYGDASFHGFLAIDEKSGEVIAYAIIKIGFLEHESFRLRSYGFLPDQFTDSTFAPSVADDWQSRGIGHSIFQFALSYLKKIGIQRIILWGGVQSGNEKALGFYRKLGFITLGEFEYYGMNYDMYLPI
jgi:diamine N-acetyltransferase